MTIIEQLQEKLSDITQFGTERYVGKSIGSWFYIVYLPGGRAGMKMYNPYFHSALGCVKGNRIRRKKIFCGLTDPVMAGVMFILSFLLFFLILQHFVSALMLAVIWCVGVGGITYLISRYTATGKDRRDKLEKFLQQLEVSGN